MQIQNINPKVTFKYTCIPANLLTKQRKTFKIEIEDVFILNRKEEIRECLK